MGLQNPYALVDSYAQILLLSPDIRLNTSIDYLSEADKLKIDDILLFYISNYM